MHNNSNNNSDQQKSTSNTFPSGAVAVVTNNGTSQSRQNQQHTSSTTPSSSPSHLNLNLNQQNQNDASGALPQSTFAMSINSPQQMMMMMSPHQFGSSVNNPGVHSASANNNTGGYNFQLHMRLAAIATARGRDKMSLRELKELKQQEDLQKAVFNQQVAEVSQPIMKGSRSGGNQQSASGAGLAVNTSNNFINNNHSSSNNNNHRLVNHSFFSQGLSPQQVSMNPNSGIINNNQLISPSAASMLLVNDGDKNVLRTSSGNNKNNNIVTDDEKQQQQQHSHHSSQASNQGMVQIYKTSQSGSGAASHNIVVLNGVNAIISQQQQQPHQLMNNDGGSDHQQSSSRESKGGSGRLNQNNSSGNHNDANPLSQFGSPSTPASNHYRLKSSEIEFGQRRKSSLVSTEQTDGAVDHQNHYHNNNYNNNENNNHHHENNYKYGSEESPRRSARESRRSSISHHRESGSINTNNRSQRIAEIQDDESEEESSVTKSIAGDVVEDAAAQDLGALQKVGGERGEEEEEEANLDREAEKWEQLSLGCLSVVYQKIFVNTLMPDDSFGQIMRKLMITAGFMYCPCSCAFGGFWLSKMWTDPRDELVLARLIAGICAIIVALCVFLPCYIWIQLYKHASDRLMNFWIIGIGIFFCGIGICVPAYPVPTAMYALSEAAVLARSDLMMLHIVIAFIVYSVSSYDLTFLSSVVKREVVDAAISSNTTAIFSRLGSDFSKASSSSSYWPLAALPTVHQGDDVENLLYTLIGSFIVFLMTAALYLQYVEYLRLVERSAATAKMSKLVAGQLREWDMTGIKGTLAEYRKAPNADHKLYNQFVSIVRTVGEFAKFVPREVVVQLMQSTSGLNTCSMEPKTLTISFQDIANFTTIAESLDVETLVKLMSVYFAYATKVLSLNHSTIDKFIGDCVMSVWGAPEALEHQGLYAIAACLQMQGIVKRVLNIKFEEEGFHLAVRMGVHRGLVVNGVIGSKLRCSWTSLGDSVNLASRLEGLNKYFRTKVCVSTDVMADALTPQGNSIFTTRRLGLIKVKGKNEPTAVYQVIGVSPEGVIFAKNQPETKQIRTNSLDSSNGTSRRGSAAGGNNISNDSFQTNVTTHSVQQQQPQTGHMTSSISGGVLLTPQAGDVLLDNNNKNKKHHPHQSQLESSSFLPVSGLLSPADRRDSGSVTSSRNPENATKTAQVSSSDNKSDIIINITDEAEEGGSSSQQRERQNKNDNHNNNTIKNRISGVENYTTQKAVGQAAVFFRPPSIAVEIVAKINIAQELYEAARFQESFSIYDRLLKKFDFDYIFAEDESYMRRSDQLFMNHQPNDQPEDHQQQQYNSSHVIVNIDADGGGMKSTMQSGLISPSSPLKQQQQQKSPSNHQFAIHPSHFVVVSMNEDASSILPAATGQHQHRMFLSNSTISSPPLPQQLDLQQHNLLLHQQQQQQLNTNGGLNATIGSDAGDSGRSSRSSNHGPPLRRGTTMNMGGTLNSTIVKNGSNQNSNIQNQQQQQYVRIDSTNENKMKNQENRNIDAENDFFHSAGGFAEHDPNDGDDGNSKGSGEKIATTQQQIEPQQQQQSQNQQKRKRGEGENVPGFILDDDEDDDDGNQQHEVQKENEQERNKKSNNSEETTTTMTVPDMKKRKSEIRGAPPVKPGFEWRKNSAFAQESPDSSVVKSRSSSKGQKPLKDQDQDKEETAEEEQQQQREDHENDREEEDNKVEGDKNPQQQQQQEDRILVHDSAAPLPPVQLKKFSSSLAIANPQNNNQQQQQQKQRVDSFVNSQANRLSVNGLSKSGSSGGGGGGGAGVVMASGSNHHNHSTNSGPKFLSQVLSGAAGGGLVLSHSHNQQQLQQQNHPSASSTSGGAGINIMSKNNNNNNNNNVVPFGQIPNPSHLNLSFSNHSTMMNSNNNNNASALLMLNNSTHGNNNSHLLPKWPKILFEMNIDRDFLDSKIAKLKDLLSKPLQIDFDPAEEMHDK